MKIALIGYGKMGKAIEEIALKEGHEIALIIDAHNTTNCTVSNLQQVDVAIEFTGPHSAVQNIKTNNSSDEYQELFSATCSKMRRKLTSFVGTKNEQKNKI